MQRQTSSVDVHFKMPVQKALDPTQDPLVETNTKGFMASGEKKEAAPISERSNSGDRGMTPEQYIKFAKKN